MLVFEGGKIPPFGGRKGEGAKVQKREGVKALRRKAELRLRSVTIVAGDTQHTHPLFLKVMRLDLFICACY